MARSQRNKIEPLNYTEAASAPALKGMTSFLDITPEQFRGFEVLRSATTASPTEAFSGLVPTHGCDEAPGVVSSLGDVSSPALGVKAADRVTATNLFNLASGVESSPAHVRPPGVVSTPGDASNPASGIGVDARAEKHVRETQQLLTSTAAVYAVSPGDETIPVYDTVPRGETPGVHDVTPGRGRSRVRRCTLAQDGHSLGEEAIYQVLWRSGRAETSDPTSARLIRMGAADLGYRVNMAKKNVRLNISRLFEKLSLEVVEDFETVSSQARLYRVFSYRQILERRRAAGLEYVLRNKGVVFCTADGNELVSSPAYVTTPGDETYRPAAPPLSRNVRKKRLSQVNPQQQDPVSFTPEEVASVSAELNRCWLVDEAAAEQLLQACRRFRPDCTTEEIGCFISQKVDLVIQSGKIQNPTGFVLSTVPQCFQGSAFEQFRRRRQAADDRRAEEGRGTEAGWDAPESALLDILNSPILSAAQRQQAQHRLDRIRQRA